VKVLITGAGGQLGQALMRDAPAGIQAVALRRAECDLVDHAALLRCLDAIRPQILINAAAYTAVDQAETDRATAFAANADAVGRMARACRERAIKLVHVSTDFVFDGTLSRPYRPDDVTNPLSVYGASKLAGEQFITAESGLDWRIVRTSWVYSATGRNFLLTMLRLFSERQVVNVVSDQVGTPTSAHTLAQCAWRAATADGTPAIMHFSDAGVASWYDFAVSIYEEASTLRLVKGGVHVAPIATEQYPTPARRPSYSVLDTRSTLSRLSITPIHWRECVRKVLRELPP
jgi:dTDP-4-dehydrorhamnose reductase